MTDTNSLSLMSSSIKDLIKHYVVTNVNTGDKPLDNILIPLLIMSLTYICSLFSFKSLILKYNLWRNRKCLKLNETNYKFYKEYIENNKFSNVSWVDDTFGDKLGKYYYDNVPCKSWPACIDTETLALKGQYSQYYKGMLVNLQTNEIVPFYLEKSGIIGVVKQTSSCYICYNNVDTLRTFVKMIKNINLSSSAEKEESGKHLQIQDHRDNVLGHIYPDRNFDAFVSCHKTRILNVISKFELSLQGKNTFGGYGSKNLGIIVHGKPGTGKTMLIKAMCNRFHRNACIVNMRKIKTKIDFELLFDEKLGKSVYVLDEFDCVQDVIHDRTLNNEEKKFNPLDQLKERHLALLALVSNSTEVSPHITEEIKSVSKQIEDYENRLTLDTILTVLDGTLEKRGRIIIATTNHVDKIDSALLRFGRFDLIIELKEYNADETRELLGKIFAEDASEEEFEYLNSVQLREYEFTPTKLIELCMTNLSLRKVVDIIKK